MSNSDDKKIDRPYGVYTTPQALIGAVNLQYYKGDESQRDIAANLKVPVSTVLAIIAQTWGEPGWYVAEHKGVDMTPEPAQVKSEPRGQYNVDHANATLHCRVTKRDKAGWVKRAQKAGQSLAQWVIEQLNTGADLKGRYRGDAGEDPLLGLQEECESLLEHINANNTRLNEKDRWYSNMLMADNVGSQTSAYRMRFLIGQMVKDRFKSEEVQPYIDMADVERLVEHIAVMGIELRDGADVVDASTESFRGLPDHLQRAINEAGEILEPNGEGGEA